MFSKAITLAASKAEFVFSDGRRESRFRPVVYFAPDKKKIVAIGNPPADGGAHIPVDIFNERDPAVDPVPVLASMIRFGVRSVAAWFISRPPSLTITIAPDLRAELKGLAPSIFRAAATQAQTVKVEIHEERS